MEVTVRFGHPRASWSATIANRSLRPYLIRAERYLRRRSERGGDLR